MNSDGSNGETLIEARDLRFSYGAGLPEVVRGASLSLRRGTLAALIGANGSGKSSLVRLLCGLREPTNGEALFGGRPLSSIEPRERAREAWRRRAGDSRRSGGMRSFGVRMSSGERDRQNRADQQKRNQTFRIAGDIPLEHVCPLSRHLDGGPRGKV